MGIVQQIYWRVSITLDAMRRDGLPGAWNSQEGPGGTAIRTYHCIALSEAARPPRFKSEIYIPNIYILWTMRWLLFRYRRKSLSHCRQPSALRRLRVIRVDAFVPS